MGKTTSFTSRNQVIRWVSVFVALAVVLGAAAFSFGDIGTAIGQSRVKSLNARIENVYTTEYQEEADSRLAEERDSKERTLDDIFVAENPYGTNTTSLYVYFNTDDPASVSYTVSADGYPDFTRTAYQDEEYQTEHEFTVLGLIPDKKNTITFTVTDEDGDEQTASIERTGTPLLGVEEVQLEQTKVPEEGTDLGDGLYAILGNDSDDQDFMFYYDVNGVLRGEIPVLYYRSHRLLFDDDGLMWFSASTEDMVGMNRLGKLEKIYNLGDQFILHHDYTFDNDGDIVLLGTDLTRSDHAVQDQVVKLDVETGEVSLLLDFGDMFPDYKQSTDHAGIDESDLSASGRWDWLHCNTVQMLPDGSALFSARETSTIIKVDDLETDPTLDYMIGEPSVWDGTEYQDAFLTKDGDFPDTGGQHSITYDSDDSLPDGQYYLYMFDNNYGYAMTRSDFDWNVIDGIVTDTSDSDATSQFRKYLIDEDAGTYTEIDQFDVPFSAFVSSVQELDDGHILIDSGGKGLFGQYDTDGDLLVQYYMEPNTSYIYRVYSYDFDGFYFA